MMECPWPVLRNFMQPADPLGVRRRQTPAQQTPQQPEDDTVPPPPPPPRLPGQSFAMEHRVAQKKNHFRPFLGDTGVEDAKRFVAFVLEASGRLGPDAAAFLRSLCHFPILRFRSLVSVISAKHNAQMALRWVRYLRRPI